MTSCNLIANWDQMTEDQRFDALEELIHEALEAWGFEDVPVRDSISDDAVPAQYRLDTREIEINPDAIEGGEPPWDELTVEDMLGIALHEAIHAAEEQMGFELNHFAVAQLGYHLANEMFEGCISSVDSVPAHLPNHPFQSSESLPPGLTKPFG